MIAAVPAAAVGQDAGSNQYQDPLAGEPGSNPSNSTPSGGGSNTAPSNDTQNVQSETNADDTQAAQSRDQLPATGVDAWLLVLAGAVLLAGGVGLRRTVERPTL